MSRATTPAPPPPGRLGGPRFAGRSFAAGGRAAHAGPRLVRATHAAAGRLCRAAGRGDAGPRTALSLWLSPAGRLRRSDPVLAGAPLPSYSWSAAIDALFLERSSGGSTPLGYTAYNGPSPQPQPSTLYSDDVYFPLTTGMRLELSRKFDNDMAITATYWGLQQWSVGNTIYADPYQYTVLAYSPYLQLPAILHGLDDSLGYTYASQIENVELNGLFRLSSSPYWQLDWLFGARYIYFADHFTLTGVDDLNTATEQVDYHTTNNLWGVQTGLLFTQGWNRFRWEAGLKVGVMVNSYSQHGTDTVSDPAGVPAGFKPYDISNSGSGVSGLGEFTLAACYRLTDNLWCRLGYQVYDIGGLALGPRQLGGFGHGGNVCLDGVSIGLQATW